MWSSKMMVHSFKYSHVINYHDDVFSSILMWSTIMIYSRVFSCDQLPWWCILSNLFMWTSTMTMYFLKYSPHVSKYHDDVLSQVFSSCGRVACCCILFSAITSYKLPRPGKWCDWVEFSNTFQCEQSYLLAIVRWTPVNGPDNGQKPMKATSVFLTSLGIISHYEKLLWHHMDFAVLFWWNLCCR